MKIEKSPVGRESLLGLTCFWVTDAIAGISSGTTIKHKDYTNGQTVSVPGTIIGCNVINNMANIWVNGIVALNNSGVFKAYIRAPAGNIVANEDSSYTIRVYYI